MTRDRLRWYPAAWRARYGDDLGALLDDEHGDGPLPMLVRWSLLTGGLHERMHASGLFGSAAPPAERVRAGALAVLGGWAAFVVAGASFAKFSEHFDQALPHRQSAHTVPDVAFAAVQLVAAIGAALVVAGAAIALPAFVRFLRRGGWPAVRRRVLLAAAATVVTAAGTVPLLVWAHHLDPRARNGGMHLYGGLFLAWCALLVLTLALWTAVAIAAARRLELPRPVLAAEAVCAVAVASAMAVVLAATALWWASMARHAPSFLGASPAGAPSSPWDAWLAGTVGLMLLATVVGATGVARLALAWPLARSTTGRPEV